MGMKEDGLDEEEKEYLKNLTADNQQTATKIATYTGRRLDASAARFEVFLTFMEESGQWSKEDRLHYEIAFQEHIAYELAEIMQQIQQAKAQETLGINPTQNVSILGPNGERLV